jgi:hypothetical protein
MRPVSATGLDISSVTLVLIMWPDERTEPFRRYYSWRALCPNLASTQENRSPFGLVNGTLASYLLFSATLWPSVAGACLVGAGSLLDSWLGEPAVSVLAGPPFATPPVDPPMVAEESGRFGTFSEYSSESTMAFFFRCSSNRDWRSALMLFFAK